MRNLWQWLDRQFWKTLTNSHVKNFKNFCSQNLGSLRVISLPSPFSWPHSYYVEGTCWSVKTTSRKSSAQQHALPTAPRYRLQPWSWELSPDQVPAWVSWWFVPQVHERTHQKCNWHMRMQDKSSAEGFIFWVPSVWMWCRQLVPIKKHGKWKTLITMKSDRRPDSPTST